MSFPDRHLIDGPVDPDWIAGLTRRASGRSGACASFLGVIRADLHASGEGAVEAIDYSAYRPMAERILAGIAKRVADDHGLHEVVVVHSVGRVAAGEASMLVFVRAAHRAEAFDGLRAAVEAIKAGAPVWKLEHYSDGSRRWVEGDPASTPPA